MRPACILNSSDYIALNGRVIMEWTGKDERGNNHGLIDSIILAFASKDWGKPWETSVREHSLLAEIRTQDISNTKRQL